MAIENVTTAGLIKRGIYFNFSDLPFVADVKVAPRKTRRNCWHVPPIDDYGQANDAGRQYACDFVQYLKQNPGAAGSNIISHLIDDMDQHLSGIDKCGYAVGFWSFIEQLLYVAAITTDHHAIAQQDADRYAAIRAARKTE